MATKLGEAYVVIKAQLGPLRKGIRSARLMLSRLLVKQLSNLIKKGLAAPFKIALSFIKGIFRGIVKAAKTAVKAVVVAFTAITAAVIKAGGGFEFTMSRVQALTGTFTKETIPQFKELQKVAKQLGETTEFSARQVSEGMSFLALAGFETQKIIKAMPATLTLASTAQIELAQASNIAAKVMAGMGLTADELGRAVDVMAKAVTTSNTDIVALGDAMRFVGPVGKTLNKSLEEVVATLQSLAQGGFEGTMAGTQLRNAYSRLAGAIPAATKVMKKLGIETSTAAGKMLPMADIVDQFNDKLKGLTEVERTATLFAIFGQRAGPGFAKLLDRGGDSIRQFEKNLKGAAGTAATIARVQLDNARGDWIKLKSVVEGVLISIYDQIRGPARAGIQGLTQWFKDNKAEILEWSDKVYGAVLKAFGIFMEWANWFKTDWKGALKFAFDVAVDYFTRLAKIIGMLMQEAIFQISRRISTALFNAAENAEGYLQRGILGSLAKASSAVTRAAWRPTLEADLGSAARGEPISKNVTTPHQTRTIEEQKKTNTLLTSIIATLQPSVGGF